MTVDHSMTSPLTSEPRTFTVQHDQILHAVVEQLNEVTARLRALEAAALTHAAPTIDVTDGSDTPVTVPETDETSNAKAGHAADSGSRTRSGRQAGWQPARR